MDLCIPPNEFFTLLGPSGCGKTTTLRLIAGFEQPSEGEMFIMGKPMTNIPPNQRPVNTVFQDYALFPHLSVEKNVGFGLTIKRVPRLEKDRRVAEALELVQLTGMGQRKPSQLSGGQQQRVALARALVNQPSVLLLDEPLGALDLKLRKDMQIELKHLQEQVGITFIYVTHDQEEALTMSDRIAVMKDGIIQQMGDAVSLYEEPANHFVADFIGESNFINGTFEGMEQEWAVIRIGNQRSYAMMSSEKPAQNAATTITIRPERMVISSPGEQEGPGISGTITEVVYIGTDIRYLLELATGQEIQIRIQNRSKENISAFPKGATVKISWVPEDAKILAN
ncbi:MAG: ABC transporter ATP-binding protein [Chloroflexi bacterium]|nr:ABC transporter ATP-binding protein [Chloroflexota bacterium]